MPVPKPSFGITGTATHNKPAQQRHSQSWHMQEALQQQQEAMAARNSGRQCRVPSCSLQRPVAANSQPWWLSGTYFIKDNSSQKNSRLNMSR
jgi:hypothetical protein